MNMQNHAAGSTAAYRYTEYWPWSIATVRPWTFL